MRITLFYPSAIPYSEHLLANTPLGGSGTAVLHMTRTLSALEHRVEILRQAKDLDRLRDVDVSLLKRHPILLKTIPAKRIYFGTPDDIDQCTFELLRHPLYRTTFLNQINKVFVISSYQSHQIQDLGVPQQQIWQTRNGIDLKLFAPEAHLGRPMRCIYTSTPFRGLNVLISVWALIHQEVPSSELHIYSSTAVYQQPERAEYEVLYDLAKRMEGVTYFGSVPQRQLAEALCESRLWLYPNTFPETSCIAAMEAQAAGCVLITSAIGALPETAGGKLFVYGNPLSNDYLAAFASYAIQLLLDPKEWQLLSERNRKRAQLFDWIDVAKEWSVLFRK